MKPLTEYLGVDIAFSLPDWFPPERLEFTTHHTYPEGHAWAGQTHETGTVNKATNALLNMKNVKEVNAPGTCGSYVIFHIEAKPEMIPMIIEALETKLTTFLSRYKEAREVEKK